MNYLIIFLISLTARTIAHVDCEDKPAELKSSAGTIELSDKLESKAEESATDLKSKDGDTLETLASQQSDSYNYVISKQPSPLSIDLGSYDTPGQAQPASISQSSQYDSQSQVVQQSPVTVYRTVEYNSGADTGAGEQAEQEPLYAQKSYIRQPSMEDRPDSGGRVQTSAGTRYPVPELPRTKPGISSTYTSPDMKIVSHTRSFLPVVYKKPLEESDSDSSGGQTGANAEQEYDKAVEDRPGGSYASEQQSASYDADQERDQNSEQASYSNGSGQRQRQRARDQESDQDEPIVRTPYYHIHKPMVAHVQVLEDKDEYRNQQKDGFGLSQQSYGLRTQPRPQYKNYKPSGYKPGMMNAYSPPSPPLSSFLPPPPSNAYTHKSGEQLNDDSYDEDTEDHVEQSGRAHIPGPQALQQQSQSPHEYKQSPHGVEIEFDQAHKNEPNVIRGPGMPYRPTQEAYTSGTGEQSADDHRGAAEAPEYNPGSNFYLDNENSYENNDNTRGQDYESNNQLGPKYNVDSDSEGQTGLTGLTAKGYKRGPPQLVKPQKIEYGFRPLSETEMKQMGENGYAGQSGFRSPSNRGRPQEQFGAERHRQQNRDYGGNGANGGQHRRPRPHFRPERPESMGIMYGRGQGEGHRGSGYDGNDVYRDESVGQMQPGLNGRRKPAFDRKPFGAEDNGGYGPALKDDEEEEVDQNEDMTYGKHNDNTIASDNREDAEGMGVSNADKLPYECYPWNCNPWHAIHPDSPYNSPRLNLVGAALKGRGQSHGSGLPPGASYNPKDVGLDEAIVAQLNLAASAPPGMAPPRLAAHGFRGAIGGPAMDIPYSGSRPLPSFNNGAPTIPVAPGMPVQRPHPRPQPYSANGQGFRSQYGYRAAASEQSPVSAPAGNNSPGLSNLLNLNPVKSFRSLMSYITGGING